MVMNDQPEATERQTLLQKTLLDEESQKATVPVVVEQATTANVQSTSRSTARYNHAGAHRRTRSEQLHLLNGTGNNAHTNSKRGTLHHRRQTSMSRFIASIGDGPLGAIVEDVAGDATAILTRKLEAADSGRFRFLDTGLVRGLSVLPDDLETMAEEVLLNAQDPGLEGQKEPTSTSLAGPCLSLLVAVLAISSNGTALALQHGVHPALKLYWRMTAVALVLFGSVVKSHMTSKESPFQSISASHTTTLGLAIVCFAIQSLCFFMALNYTTIGNAVIFANSQALILLVGKFLRGHAVLFMEGAGAFVAFAGAILCACSETHESSGSISDTSQTDDTSNAHKAIIGDLLAMCSALFGVGYLTFASAVRPHISVTTFMFLVMSCGSVLVLSFLVMMVGIHEVTFDNDPYHGLFGWTAWRWDRLGVELWIVLVCNLVGTMGLVRGMAYFDSIIIAVATLLEPLLASIIAYSLKVGVLPDVWGWIGNAVVIMGTIAVVYPSATRGERDTGH
jgi:drug/metabolite transporter (DMT)-like permease